MNKLLSAPGLASILLSVTACSSDYVISTREGHMMTARGKPVTDSDTGLLSYQSVDGRMHHLHEKDVKEIIEK